MDHNFNVDAAVKIGVAPAIILNSMYWWIKKNECNDRHFHDGFYWTYNSRKALCMYFPYFSERQIEYALRKLIDQGYLIAGNYNKSTYDRTLWYAITEKGYSIFQKGEIHSTNLLNGNTENVEPIPDDYTVKNTNISTDKDTVGKNQTTDPPYKEIIDYLNEKTNSHYRHTTKATQRIINGRLSENFTVDDFKRVIDIKTEQWLNDKKMSAYLRPETLFAASHFESYLNEARETVKESKYPGLSERLTKETESNIGNPDGCDEFE